MDILFVASDESCTLITIVLPLLIKTLQFGYNISNFFGMEQKQNTFRFLDDSNQLPREQNLLPANFHNSLQDLDQGIQNKNTQNNQQKKYYEQYKRVYTLSYQLWCKKEQLRQTNEEISSKINNIERNLEKTIGDLQKTERNEEESDIPEEGEKQQKIKSNKRMRRTAEEIQRKYRCTAEQCIHSYGSIGSLQQHIKLKHPQLYNKSAQSQQPQRV